jgi:hypothetical protein
VTQTRVKPQPAQEQPLSAIRMLRESLRVEERRVSYWRRLVQGRIDLVRAGLAGKTPTLDDLAAPHRRIPARHRSPAAVDLLDGVKPSPLRTAEHIWQSPVPWTDPDGLSSLEARLVELETELSAYRHLLHDRIDASTDELIRRYQHDLAAVPDLDLDDGDTPGAA